MHIGQPLFRGFRALVFAVACTGVSAGLHVTAGGDAIGPAAMVAAVAAVTALGLLLGGRARGPLTLIAACAAAQAGLHVWFTLGSDHSHHLAPSGSMLLVHALAAVASALWLACAEDAFEAFIDLLVMWYAPRLPASGVRARPMAPPRPAPPAPAVAAPAPAPLVASVALRGPPSGSSSP